MLKGPQQRSSSWCIERKAGALLAGCAFACADAICSHRFGLSAKTLPTHNMVRSIGILGGHRGVMELVAEIGSGWELSLVHGVAGWPVVGTVIEPALE